MLWGLQGDALGVHMGCEITLRAEALLQARMHVVVNSSRDRIVLKQAMSYEATRIDIFAHIAWTCASLRHALKPEWPEQTCRQRQLSSHGAVCHAQYAGAHRTGG